MNGKTMPVWAIVLYCVTQSSSSSSSLMVSRWPRKWNDRESGDYWIEIYWEINKMLKSKRHTKRHLPACDIRSGCNKIRINFMHLHNMCHRVTARWAEKEKLPLNEFAHCDLHFTCTNLNTVCLQASPHYLHTHIYFLNDFHSFKNQSQM